MFTGFALPGFARRLIGNVNMLSILKRPRSIPDMTFNTRDKSLKRQDKIFK